LSSKILFFSCIFFSTVLSLLLLLFSIIIICFVTKILVGIVFILACFCFVEKGEEERKKDFNKYD